MQIDEGCERLLSSCHGAVGFDIEYTVELSGPRVLGSEPTGIVQLSTDAICVIVSLLWLSRNGVAVPDSLKNLLADKCVSRAHCLHVSVLLTTAFYTETSRRSEWAAKATRRACTRTTS